MVRKLTTLSLLLGIALCSAACRSSDPEPFVVLIGLDGASEEVIDDLRSEGRLPNFDRLIRSGTYGRLQSYASRKIMSNSLQRGYFSPIVWSTIATGKIPERHGVRDFVLPIPGTSSVWMGSEHDPVRSELRFPEIQGEGSFTLHLRIRSHAYNGPQDVQILLNNQPLEILRVPAKWEEFQIPLSDLLRPAKNRLVFISSKQSVPADRGKSDDRRRLACELAFFRIVDARGQEVFFFDPVFERFALDRGFYKPRGNLTEVQSVHLRAQPIWSLLGALGHPVGILGYWGTWPANEVNGFLVSSRMGIRSKRTTNLSRLTWPEELRDELLPLDPTREEMEPIVRRLHLADCDPPTLEQHTVVQKIVVQDEFYHRIALRQIPKMDRGFFTIYVRAIDVSCHTFLHWRHGGEMDEGCPESARGIVDEVYVLIDERIGEILDILPPHAKVVLVSDHGMTPIDTAGYHAPFGIFIARGPGIRSGATLHGGSVLDIAPTLLQMFEAPIPFDMDGKLLHQVFESSWLSEHAPRYVELDTSLEPVKEDEEMLTEGRDEILDQLRALGYIQ
jgi:predicted AlkP superfamily phosphohydrolase/phosphomutase